MYTCAGNTITGSQVSGGVPGKISEVEIVDVTSENVDDVGHRRRSSVNFGGSRHFCPKICMKI